MGFEIVGHIRLREQRCQIIFMLLRICVSSNELSSDCVDFGTPKKKERKNGGDSKRENLNLNGRQIRMGYVKGVHSYDNPYLVAAKFSTQSFNSQS